MKTSLIKGLQISNLAVVVVMFVVNILSNALPLNGKTAGELSDAIPNYFVPAGFVFSIWGVIYVLQFMFGFYQVRKQAASQGFIERIGPWSIVANSANALWLFAWHWQLVPLSLVFMIVFLVALLLQYVRLGIGLPGKRVPKGEWWFVHLPVSVYLGWISVATVANVTAVLVDAGVPSFDGAALAWTIAILAVVGILGTLVLVRNRDIGYIAVFEWALFGIALKQAAFPSIAAAAWIVMLVLAVIIIFVLLRARAKNV